MPLGRVILRVFGFLGAVSVPVAVVVTTGLFERNPLPWRIAGFVGTALIIGFVEFAWASPAGDEKTLTLSFKFRWGPPEEAKTGFAFGALVCTWVMFLVPGTYLYFPYVGLLLLAYAVGVALVLIRRRKGALTKWDWLYLRWAWVPIITIGVPLWKLRAPF
jgi:hypothetical protein